MFFVTRLRSDYNGRICHESVRGSLGGPVFRNDRKVFYVGATLRATFVLALGFVLPVTALAAKPTQASKAPSLFDPLSILATPAPTEKATVDRLTARSIYRIEGVRFQKFISLAGIVYIESPSSVPDFDRGRVLCDGEMHPSWEVIRIRDDMDLTSDVTNHARTILGHIERCGKP